MNKKIFNILVFLPIFVLFDIVHSQCGDFEIQEDYFADQLIGFYINSIKKDLASNDRCIVSTKV